MLNMPDYQNGKIYKITGNGLTYYGSTTQTLPKRLKIHKSDKKSGKSGSVNPILDVDYKIELVELYPCNTKEELLEREKFYIVNNECVNIKTPNLTEEEMKLSKKIYQQNHKEMTKASTAKWEEANKEKRKEYHRQRYIRLNLL